MLFYCIYCVFHFIVFLRGALPSSFIRSVVKVKETESKSYTFICKLIIPDLTFFYVKHKKSRFIKTAGFAVSTIFWTPLPPAYIYRDNLSPSSFTAMMPPFCKINSKLFCLRICTTNFLTKFAKIDKLQLLFTFAFPYPCFLCGVVISIWSCLWRSMKKNLYTHCFSHFTNCTCTWCEDTLPNLHVYFI